jgi:UDP-N-acetylmuramoylalanine-D-glutamate ligase
MRIAAGDRKTTLPRRVLASLACFDGQVLVVVSGDDPSAREFSRLVERHHLKCRRVHIPGANHSLSNREWRDEVASVGANWIVSW